MFFPSKILFVSFIIFFYGLLQPFIACAEIERANVKIEAQLFSLKPNSTYDLKRDVDLQGQTISIPKGVTIRQSGGIIKNGKLIGNKTKIIARKAVFDNVSIQGTWDVENISTSLFRDLSYENSLRDVMALASPSQNNYVRIEKGNYFISLDEKHKVGISVPSKTHLVIDGNIILRPNSLSYYEIVNTKGSDITISGRGSIVGDKHSHTGSQGEWGMGLYIRGKNINVRNITIRDCWGDCIYVGNDARNVHIDKCLLDNGRRQGISITSARNVYINDCVIKNVSGTAPEFAIDMEPNKGDTVTHIYIQNIKIQNCVGGITASGKVKSSYLGDIYIDNCVVDDKVKLNSFQFYYANKVTLMNCTALDSSRKIQFKSVNTIISKKNFVKGKVGHENYKDCKMVNGRRQ